MADDQPQSGAGGTGDSGIVPESERWHRRGDLRMRAMAIRKRWIIPEKADETLPDEMYRIATTRTEMVLDANGNPVEVSNSRSQIAATKVLLEMEGQNQADEHKESAQPTVNNNGPTQINYYLAQPPPPDAPPAIVGP